MPQAKDKATLIEEFNQMKEIEKSAQDFYLQVSQDSRVKDEIIRNTFKEIADDEERHVQIVQKIINIINNNL